MAVNKHFHDSDKMTIASERNLYQDLVTEVIQIYGHDVHYVDREAVAEDTFLGEDALSKFELARKIEMYVEDGDGWRGDDLIMSRFGLQDMSAVTFVVSVPRFQTLSNQIAIEDGTDSTGGAILLDSGSAEQAIDAGGSILINATDSSSSNSGDEFLLDGTDSSSTDAGDKIILNATAIESYSKLEGSDFYLIKDNEPTGLNRPYEGDLIFHPIFGMLFEIKSVEDEEPFYQLDNLPVYKMSCQIFDYSSETLDTGITEIDEVQDQSSLASSDHQVTLEQTAAVTINQGIRIYSPGSDSSGLLLDETDSDNIICEDETNLGGESILLETGGDEYIIQESYIIGQGTRGDDDLDRQAQNELFDTLDDAVLDFSESNPFGDAGSIN